MLTPCLQTCLYHVYTNIDMFTGICTQCIQTQLNLRFPIPLLFEDMFAKRLQTCWQTCFHHVYIYVYIMFTLIFTTCLQTYLHHFYRHVCRILEDIFTQCWKTCLRCVWRLCLKQVWKHVYSRYEQMCTICCKKYLQSL